MSHEGPGVPPIGQSADLSSNRRAFPWIGAGIAVLVVVLLLALFRFGITRSDQPLVEQSGPARDFTLTLFPGQPSPVSADRVRLSDLRGRPVIVNFWASWCVPCREEVPALDRAWRKYRDHGLVILGIDIQDTEANALDFIRRYGATYANGPDRDGAITIDYGVVGVPETFFVDRNGNLLRKYIGPVPPDTLEQLIAQLLK